MVGFLTDKDGLTRDDIVVYPTLMVRSLEAHTRRCAVLDVLRRAGKQQTEHRLPRLLVFTKEKFLDVYVRPHMEEVPDVLGAMDGEIPFQGCDSLERKQKLPNKKSVST
ncbi:hypothetical protein EJB05_35520, partial [Eragrostis curvula]